MTKRITIALLVALKIAVAVIVGVVCYNVGHTAGESSRYVYIDEIHVNEDGSVAPLDALRVLRETSKAIHRRMWKGDNPTADEFADWSNAIITANSVKELKP